METPTQILIKSALNNGVPKDQLKNFLINKYIPLKWQLRFHALARECDKPDGPVKLGVGGSRGPGKSHSVFAQMALDDCQRVDGLKGLFLRQTGKAAQESFNDLILRVISGKIPYNYSEHKGLLEFPNNSRILLGGFRNENDIDNYIGIEYDLISIEELNQLTEKKVDMLLGSMRTSKLNWRPRLYSSFNPGGLGHVFVKDTFVIPYREKRETETRYIPSTYQDNPYLNKEYIDYLEGLTGTLGRAWREGDFDIFEGQYFSEWRNEHHVIPPFQIPDTWKRYRGYDHGREAPACCKWYAVDYDGNVFAYRELYVKGWNADQIAREIVRLTPENERIEYTVADASIFSKIGHGETIGEIMARNGVMCIPSSKDRVAGWNVMHEYLYWDNFNEPKLRYFNTCFNSIRTIPSLIHDEHRPEDLDSSGEDHAIDCDRYLLQTLRQRKTTEPKTGVELKLQKIKEKEESLRKLYEDQL